MTTKKRIGNSDGGEDGRASGFDIKLIQAPMGSWGTHRYLLGKLVGYAIHPRR
jgi:hypothetical protein